jgi:outer membrane protein assembly factor BamD (BamD/ComL family)
MAATQNAQSNLADVLREYPIPGYVLDIKQLMASWKNVRRGGTHLFSD